MLKSYLKLWFMKWCFLHLLLLILVLPIKNESEKGLYNAACILLCSCLTHLRKPTIVLQSSSQGHKEEQKGGEQPQIIMLHSLILNHVLSLNPTETKIVNCNLQVAFECSEAK